MRPVSEIFTCSNCGGTKFTDTIFFNAVVTYGVSNDKDGITLTREELEIEEEVILTCQGCRVEVAPPGYLIDWC